MKKEVRMDDVTSKKPEEAGEKKETLKKPEEAGERTKRSRSRAAFRERQKALSREEQGEKRPFPWMAAAIGGLAAAALCTVFYVYKAQKYESTYLPHTVVNGQNVSGMTAEEVKDLISREARDYTLRLSLRGDKTEVISGQSVGLHTEFDGSLEEIIHQQNPYAWPRYLLKGPSYDISAMIGYDQALLEEELQSLSCFDESQVTKPVNAVLSDYISGEGYTIIPEEEGDQLDPEKVKEAVSSALENLQPEIIPEELGCYVAPEIRQDDPALAAQRDARNRLVNITVTYTFGSRREVLNGEKIHQWLTEENGQVGLNEAMISDFVKELAQTYNTSYKTRSFKTSYGSSVEVQGVYGWRISQQEEAEELKSILEAGESVVREPVYAQKAASHDGNDYGNTYAEVNLTAQHMFFYKDGEKILESDFVSGNVAKGYTTPPGIFSLTYKQRDAVLKGQGYSSPVKFWMPFNGGIGFHDASWRSSFGGTIYKTNGSHGCINMPYAAAKTLFENVYAGMPVICYNLAGTESAKTSQASGKETPAATAAAVPSTTAASETVPAETAAPAEDPAADPEARPGDGSSAGPGESQSGGQAAAGSGAGQSGPGGAAGPGESQSGPGGTADSGPGQSGSGSAAGPGGGSSEGSSGSGGSQGGPGETTGAGAADGGAAGGGAAGGGATGPGTAASAAAESQENSQNGVIIQPVA